MKRKMENLGMKSDSLRNNCSMDEYEVCAILLQLPHLIAVDSLRQCPLKRVTKRRSIRNRRPLYPHRISSLIVNHHGSEPSDDMEVEPSKVKAVATSPETTLCFLESESDEKRKPSKPMKKLKVSLTKNKEELLQIVNELTHNRDSLKGEMEKVKSHRDRLKIENVELKARKHKINLGPTELPSIKDRTAEIPYLIVFTNKVGPVSIPDPNVSSDESLKMEHSQPSDLEWANNYLHRTAMAASARQKRIQICRVKKRMKVKYTEKQ